MAPKPETKTLIEMSYFIVTRQSQTHFNVSSSEGCSFTNLILILLVYAYENEVKKGCLIFIWFLHWKSWILPNDLK